MAELSNLEKLGLAALMCALVLARIDSRLALIPTPLWLILCLVAPFLPRCSLYLPVISNGAPGRRAVALTFDDGPDPATTPHLLRLLKKHCVSATFFVIGQRALAHPDLIRDILDAGHSIGNHSFHHDPFVSFRGQKKIAEEVHMTQRVLTDLGVTPLVFRPPVGVTYPGLWKALKELGLVAVTFSRRALDRGNRSIGRIAERILGKVRDGDIIELHDHPPQHPASIEAWLAEVETLVSGITLKGLKIRPLSELIGRPVDRRPPSPLEIQAAGPAGNCASKGDRTPDNRP